MNENYEKFFKVSETSKINKRKDLILRMLAYIIYFIVSGFAGKLATLLVRPVLSLIIADNPDLENIILYCIAIAVTLALLAFFSFRNGCSDAELLNFSYFRTLLSCTLAAVIFSLLCIFAKIYYRPSGENILEYTMYPFFPPSVIIDFLIYVPIIGTIYSWVSENIFSLVLTIPVGILAAVVFYGLARFMWITGFGKKEKKDKFDIQEERDFFNMASPFSSKPESKSKHTKTQIK